MSRNLIALQNKFLGAGQTVYDELARVHERQGHVSDDDIAQLAQAHNLPPSHVRATARFYDELSQDTPAEHSLKVCNGEFDWGFVFRITDQNGRRPPTRTTCASATPSSRRPSRPLVGCQSP